MASFHTSKPTQGDENERNFAVNGTSNFSTDMVFKSVQDLMDWVQNVGRSLGYFIVTRRSNTEPSGVMSKVILMCDRGGIYCQSNKNSSIRKGSKKTNCPFHLVGKHVKIYDFWTLRVICEEHNHEPARMEVHPFAMRLSDNETRLVLDLSRKNVKPQHILSILKEHNPNNLSNMRTIYNTLQKFRKANHPETFMGQLFKSDESASPSPTVCAFDANKSKRTIDHTFTFATGNRVQELDSAKYGSLTKDIDNLLLREQMLTPSFRCPSLQADLVETNTHDTNAPNADVMVVSNDNEPKAKRPFVVNSTSDFATDMVFKSRQALMDWVQNVGRSLGYVIITKRSKTDSSGVLSKVTLMCDLGGIYKGNKKSNRNTKKINCPFELVGKYRKMYDIWTLRVICEKHNHEPALAMEGHPYAMRLSEIETCLVRDLSRKNVKPQDILSTLKEQNMNNVSSLKTIYNARQKFRKTGHTETSFIGQRINSEESASSSSTFDANKSKRTIDHTSPFPIKNEVQELDSAKFDSSSSLLYDAYTFDANKSKRTIDHTDPFVIINGVQELDSAKFYAAPSPLYTACAFDGNKSKKTIDETDPCALRNGVKELDSVKHEPVTKDVEGLLLLRKQMSMPSFRRFPSIQADLINPVKDISIANLVRDAFMHDTYAPDVDDIPVSDDEPTSVRLFQPYRGVVLNKTRAQFLMKHFLEEDYAHGQSSSGKGGQETEGECVEESQTNSAAELRDKGEYVGVHSNSNMEENNSQFDVNFDGLADIWKEMTVGFESLKNSKSTSTYYYEGRSDKSGDTDGVVLDGVKSPGKDFSVEEVTAHPMHKKQMKPHQVKGFNFLHSNLLSENPGGCILAHTPGSGITFMLISFIHSFMAKYPNARPLVVLPRGILAIWQKEFKRWQVEAIPLFDFYSKKAETCAQQLAVLKQWANTRSILFLGHKQFSTIVCDNDRSSVSAICQEILLTYPSLLILDEDHTPRNKGTDVFTSVEKVQTLRKVILSGTLYQNHLREIFNILNLVRPNFLRMEDSKMIKRRILSRVPIENLRNLSEISTDSEFYELVEQLLLKDENFERKVTVINDLREMTSKVFHYYKGDLLDELPDHVDFSVYLNLSPRQKQEVFELRNLARKFEVSSDGSAIYVHPDLKSLVKTESKDKNDDDVYKINELLEKSDEREGVKAKFFLNLLHLCALTGEKLLVFGQCLLPLKFLLRLTMKVKGWKLNKEIFMITGDHENDEREVAMDQFNNSSDAKVFFGSINSCGEGLTLVGASRIIILDVHLNPSVTRQAIGLAFRPGQVRKLYTYRLIAASSPEEEDHTTCHRKETIAKMWFEYNEYCGQNDFEMEKIDVKGCGDPFLETPWLNEDVTALYKRS